MIAPQARPADRFHAAGRFSADRDNLGINDADSFFACTAMLITMRMTLSTFHHNRIWITERNLRQGRNQKSFQREDLLGNRDSGAGKDSG